MNYLTETIKLIKYKFFTKINDNYITFISFNGKFTDSPRALTEYIHKLDDKKEIIWLVNDVDNPEIPKYVNKIKYDSKLAWDYYCKSKIIIDNVYCLHEFYQKSNTILSKFKFKVGSFLKNKKGQYFYTTWHGTPIKKIGADSINSNIVDFSCPNTTMILNNKYTYDIMNRITFNRIKIKLLGSPKNDILFDDKIDINDIKKKLNLPLNKKIILFAPSFRTDSNNQQNVYKSGIDQINMMDIKKLLKTMKDKFGSEWVMICRFHYYVEKEINWDELHSKYKDLIINGNEFEDIMEYLKCADVLITDMSSSIFDFALANKPVLIFFPDLQNYKNNERGLYIDINDTPFAVATNFEELVDNIQSFDNNKYIDETEKFLKEFGFIEEKNASEKVAKFILEDMKNNEKDSRKI